MKWLYLIRHAKASWEHPEIPDYERPLTERGEQDAKHMGHWLKQHDVHPDAIISSPAVRALATAKIMAKKVKFPSKNIIIDPEIYEAGVEELIAVIRNLDDQANKILFFGHNPSLLWLANFLCDDHLANIPTCGIYCIEFDTLHWHDFVESENKLVFFEYPTHVENDEATK